MNVRKENNCTKLHSWNVFKFSFKVKYGPIGHLEEMSTLQYSEKLLSQNMLKYLRYKSFYILNHVYKNHE